MKEKEFAKKYVVGKNSLLGKGKYASVHLVTVTWGVGGAGPCPAENLARTNP